MMDLTWEEAEELANDKAEWRLACGPMQPATCICMPDELRSKGRKLATNATVGECGMGWIFPSVLSYCRLGLLTCKTVSQITYILCWWRR